MKRLWLSLILLMACGGGSSSDAGVSNDAGVPVCDPTTNPEAQGRLLNAPLAAEVEVIQKTPQHPGPPGPNNLP